jgi:hypothetical protein
MSYLDDGDIVVCLSVLSSYSTMFQGEEEFCIYLEVGMYLDPVVMN